MNKYIIKLIIMSIIITLIFIFQTKSSVASWIEDAASFSKGETVGDDVQMVTPGEEEIMDVSNFISGLLLGISVVVAVVTTAILGLNFIVETAEGKAKVKEALVPLFVGMIISFSAFIIWKFAISMFI